MSKRSDYLLEIGTEELPVSFLQSSAWELKEKIQEVLSKNLLEHGDVEILQTPRRLTVIVKNLSHHQAASEETIKGPPTTVAIDASGNPTPAGQGFAKKMGVAFSNLQKENFDGTDYLVYHKKSSGRPVQAVLPEILPDVVLSLSGSHFMTWDESEIRFSRAIRWLVSLLGDEPLPIRIGLAESGTVSRGHRFLADSPEVTIASVDAYKNALWKEGHVLVDQAERRQLILSGLEQKGKKLNGTVPPNEDLLNTVTLLVESPALISGTFAEDFLTLPKEVITTVMAAHQKYFPVQDSQSKLLPYFITISNNTLPDAEISIRQGNEKVLRARLEDASFFFQEDTRHPLSHYVTLLSGITFQKGLGSLLDKTNRLKSLVNTLGKQMQLSSEVIGYAARAAELCKADLATGMVRELTELQGVMGKHYAQLGKEPSAVANAIEEHYHPRFMGDDMARSPEGIALSLADKLDTMLAVFSQKDARYPTGSKDPMGLRRMALGIIQTILENNLSFNLDQALKSAYMNLGELAKESESASIERTTQFLLQRFKGYLLDQNYSYDTIDAILDSEISPFTDLPNTLERLQLLKILQQNTDSLKKIYEPANRTARILGKAYRENITASDVNPQYFQDPSEKVLFETVTKKMTDAVSSKECLPLFEQWTPAVETFFDKVLVNDQDANVRENRYALLSLLNRNYRHFADFTKLVV